MSQYINQSPHRARRRRLRNTPTWSERILWLSLRRKQIGGVTFRRQVGMGAFVLDFYASEVKLAIEADGASHADRAEYDRWRDDLISRHGVTFLRFTDAEINSNVERVVEMIQAKVEELRRAKLQENYPPYLLLLISVSSPLV